MIRIEESLDIQEDGKEVAMYPIRVTRTGTDGHQSGWTIQKRYNNFLAFHQSLKTKFPQIASQLDMPGKMINGIMKFQKKLMENRRNALEKYLNTLLTFSEICKWNEFKKFILHPDIIKILFNDDSSSINTKKSFLKNIIHSVDEGFDFIRRRSSVGSYPDSVPLQSSPFISPTASETALVSEGGVSATTAITDLFVELFELKEKSNWLRRQAVVLFLQQFFGDTVERKTIEVLRSYVSQDNANYLLKYIRDSYWPAGEWNTKWPVRTEDAKLKTRNVVRGKLLFVAKQLGGVFGKQNTLTGALRWFHLFQNRRLNQHLMYSILDELISALFPEIHSN